MLLKTDFAYLLGSLRDGSLAKSSNKTEITLASDFDYNWIKNVIVPKAARTFGIDEEKIKVYEVWTHKCQRPFFRAKVYSVDIWRLLSGFYESSNQKNWETPEAVKSSPPDIQKAYIQGFFDAEGGCRNVERYHKGETSSMNCEISIRCKHSKSPNEPLLFIKNFLENLGLNVHMRKDETGIVITGKHNVLGFYRMIGPLHPRKASNMRDLLQFYKAFNPVDA